MLDRSNAVAQARPARGIALLCGGLERIGGRPRVTTEDTRTPGSATPPAAPWNWRVLLRSTILVAGHMPGSSLLTIPWAQFVTGPLHRPAPRVDSSQKVIDMLQKTTHYRLVIFSDVLIRKAAALWDRVVNPDGKHETTTRLSVTRGRTEWEYDSIAEFLADYRSSPPTYAWFKRDCANSTLWIQIVDGPTTRVQISAPTRHGIETVSALFEESEDQSKVEPDETPPQSPSIFIGHGHSPQWRDLKDHLHEKHGYQIEAYEMGARAGHTARDVLDRMLRTSSLALMVMTAEDSVSSGEWRARQNVVHETGLFQGRLGFARAILLVEDGVELFSNVHAIEQIRYSKGKIKETFGDVLATIKREFP